MSISKATFGKTVGEYKEFKQLQEKNKNQNLRDHMTDWELILTMIGEMHKNNIFGTPEIQSISV